MEAASKAKANNSKAEATTSKPECTNDKSKAEASKTAEATNGKAEATKITISASPVSAPSANTQPMPGIMLVKIPIFTPLTNKDEWMTIVEDQLIKSCANEHAKKSITNYVNMSRLARTEKASLEVIMKRSNVRLAKEKELMEKHKNLFQNDNIKTSFTKYGFTIKEKIIVWAKNLQLNPRMLQQMKDDINALYMLENGKLLRILTMKAHPNHEYAKKIMLRYHDIVEGRMAEFVVPDNIKKEVQEFIKEQREFLMS